MYTKLLMSLTLSVKIYLMVAHTKAFTGNANALHKNLSALNEI